MLKHNAIYISLLVMVFLLTILSMLYFDDKKNYYFRHKEEARRVWKITNEGVEYFETCIDGRIFYVTEVAGGLSMAISSKSCPLKPEVLKPTQGLKKLKFL